MRRGIRAGYVIAHDGDRHTLLEDGTIVLQDGIITHVGGDYAGEVDEWLHWENMLVLPGFVNLHTHPISTPVFRSMREERRGPVQYAGLAFTLAMYDEITRERRTSFPGMRSGSY
jgi:5-methylthioadenosine/S-adenosylhomocysteine deaminase